MFLEFLDALDQKTDRVYEHKQCHAARRISVVIPVLPRPLTKTEFIFRARTGRGTLSIMKFQEAVHNRPENSALLTGKPPEHHSVYCPNCSNRLTGHRCKLICQQCGYYLSCADYY